MNKEESHARIGQLLVQPQRPRQGAWSAQDEERDWTTLTRCCRYDGTRPRWRVSKFSSVGPGGYARSVKVQQSRCPRSLHTRSENIHRNVHACTCSVHETHTRGKVLRVRSYTRSVGSNESNNRSTLHARFCSRSYASESHRLYQQIVGIFKGRLAAIGAAC